MEFLSLLATAGVPAILALVWLIRLEGRVNTEAELRKSLQERIEGFEGRIYAALERIERKLDGKMDKS